VPVVSATLGRLHAPVVSEQVVDVPVPVAATNPAQLPPVEVDGMRPAIILKLSPRVVCVVVTDAATVPLTAGPSGVPDPT
jgi:hypothetical protein